MTGTDLMARSGARWCEDHDRYECTRQRTKGRGECHQPAVRGMDACKNHVGKRLDIARTQGEANMAAWAASANSEKEPLDLGATVMDQLRLAAIRADVIGELLRIQVAAAEDQSDGLVGPTFAAGRDGQRVETGEQVRALAKLEAEWRDRVVRYAKTAHDMGIDTRQIEVLEAQVEVTMAGIMAGFGAVPGLLPADRDAFLRAFLTTIGMGDMVQAGDVAGELGVPDAE